MASDSTFQAPCDHFSGAARLAAAIRNGETSSSELLEVYINRIERFNPGINAVVTLDADVARSQADAADMAIRAGGAVGPLHGLPITIKDCLATAGLRTTCGASELADYVPTDDATAVARLKAAGAIVIGKTNLPKFAGDSQSYNDLFGTTNNPWDVSRTPGGSSGGSAAAIAAGLSALELGSDLGGSLRIPAHFTGTYTLKPTYGIIPQQGHIPPPPGTSSEPDIGTIGPIARSAVDLDIALSVMAGPDAALGVGWKLHLPDAIKGSFRDIRIAAWIDDPYSPIDAEILARYRQLIEELRASGATVTETAGPVPLADGHALSQQLIQGGISPWIPDEGYRALASRATSAAADDDAPQIRFARNITQTARDLLNARETRGRQKAEWAGFFRTYDVLLCPVTPTPAIPHDHNPDVDARTILVNGESRPYGDQFAWLQAIGAVHLPVVVAPAGLTPGGLPVGIQIVAAEFGDRTAIDFARRMQKVIGGFQAPPGFE